MFYDHWKKIALSLTGFFWASCEDTVTSTAPEYGCPDDVCRPGPIDDSSSSGLDHQYMPLYGVSEMVLESSSSTEESSSSLELIAPAYGVFGGTCYGDPESQGTYRCDDGVTCQEKVSERWVPEYNCVEDICPDYGVVAITEKTYDCDDGNTYNYAEFISRYSKVDASEGAQGE